MRLRRKIVRTQELEEPLINLTPLIDVVFVVLIAFILIAPLLAVDTIDLAHAGDGKHTLSATEDDQILALYVTADNQITLRGQTVHMEFLPRILQDMRKTSKTGKMRLFHDKEAKFGTYQFVKTCAEKAGYEEMEVVLKP